MNENVSIEQQVDFGEFEQSQAKKIKSGKSIFLGRMTWKQRLAAIIAFLILKFTTDLKWQIGLVFYLLFTTILGTYQMIKWVYHLFV